MSEGTRKMSELEIARIVLKSLSEVLPHLIGYRRSHDYTVDDRNCPFCRMEAPSLTEVFVPAMNKWSTRKVCADCFRRIQARADTWLAANGAPIYCNDPSLAAKVWKRIGRRSIAIVIEDLGAPGAAA